MAIYHLSVKIISRKRARSIVAAAAYRSASALHDEAFGIIHDYRGKSGVEHAEIVAPPNAPEWVYDRQRLWNTVETMERRKDAQLAREIEIALPVELDLADQVELVRDYAMVGFVADGMIADVAIHREDRQNPHAHLLLSTRIITKDGFGLKDAAWGNIESLLRWRQQ